MLSEEQRKVEEDGKLLDLIRRTGEEGKARREE